MKGYRIMTEDVNRDMVVSLAAARFNCFSVFTGIGYWQGNGENNLTIEIIDLDGSIGTDSIESLAMAIKVANRQEAVLVTATEIEGKLI